MHWECRGLKQKLQILKFYLNLKYFNYMVFFAKLLNYKITTIRQCC